MNNLVMAKTEQKTLSSTEVAKMVGKEHKHLLRDIRKYIEVIAKSNLGLSSYFNESSYLDANKIERPCYSVTKIGCEMIGNKLQGEKGILFTAKYVKRFNEMEDTIKEISTILTEEQKLQLAIFNAKDRQATILASAELDRFRQKQLAIAKPKVEYHDNVLNPTTENFKKLITVTDVAKDLGLTARKLNKIMNENKIIFKQGGTWKPYSKHSDIIPMYMDYHITEYGQTLKFTEKGRKWVIENLEEWQNNLK